MKIMIVSDIHGSVKYAKKIFEIFESLSADKLVVLGDLYYHGPRNPLSDEYDPMQVANLLNENVNRLIVIRGNCDALVDEMISQFEFKDVVNFVADGKTLTFTHGHYYNEFNLPKDCGQALFYGHTHKTMLKVVNGITVVNVGSFALPKSTDGQSYAVVDNGKIEVKNIDGKTLYSAELD